MKATRTGLGVALLLSLATAAAALAAMERGPKPKTAVEAAEESPFERGVAAARAGDCKTALPLLERATKGDAKNAEAWSLLAYCQRKTGRLDEAFTNYRRALELRPEFPEAREYLGEAHLQAALQQIEILRGYGDSAREELDELVAALRAASETAGGGKAPVGDSSRGDGW